MWQGRGETVWGDQTAGVMATTGEALHEKSMQPTGGAPLALTCLFRGEGAKEQDNEPYIVSRGLLSMAKLKGWNDIDRWCISSKQQQQQK